MRPRCLVAMGVIMALSGHVAIARPDEGAVAPKLGDVDSPPSGPASAESNAAQPLPATVTICQDVSQQRCWTESGATECASDTSAGAKVFRRTGSNADPGDALEDCWAAVRR